MAVKRPKTLCRFTCFTQTLTQVSKSWRLGEEMTGIIIISCEDFGQVRKTVKPSTAANLPEAVTAGFSDRAAG